MHRPSPRFRCDLRIGARGRMPGIDAHQDRGGLIGAKLKSGPLAHPQPSKETHMRLSYLSLLAIGAAIAAPQVEAQEFGNLQQGRALAN